MLFGLTIWDTLIIRSMKLFDDNVNERPVYPAQSKFALVNYYPETHFDIRRKCECWFQHILSTNQHDPGKRKHLLDLRNSFRSLENGQHDGAFFELVLHEVFLRLGFHVEIHPEVPEGTPDFRLTQGGKRVYVEAKTVGPGSDPFHRSPNEQDAINKLNTLRSPNFRIAVDMEGRLLKTLKSEVVTRKFKGLLDAYEKCPETVRQVIDARGRDAAPHEKIECGDWSLTGWLVPRPQDTRSKPSEPPIVIGPHHAKRLDPRAPVRDALHVKAKRYKTLDAPLVVAVNALIPHYNGMEHDMEVLWGDKCIVYGLGPDDTPLYSYRRNGFWWQRNQERPAAILTFWHADIRNVSQAHGCLHLNPRITPSDLPDSFVRLPHSEASDGVVIKAEGESVAEILGFNGGVFNK